MNQLRTKAEIARKVKNKEITKKQGEELLEANAAASMLGFYQTSQGGQASGQKQNNSRRPSTTPPSASPETAQTDFRSATSRDVDLIDGLNATNPRGRTNYSGPEEIADTSQLAPSALLNTQNRSFAPVFLHPPGDASSASRLGANEARDRSEAGEGSDLNGQNQATNGGAVVGAGGGVAPGTEATPGAPAGLDKLDELLLKTAIQVKQRLNKQAKDGKGGAGAATTDRGLASVQDGSTTRSDAPYAGTAAEKPSAIGMADLFGAEAPAESGASLSAKRLARDLAAKLDETSEELVGSKLAVWFLLFFIFGFGFFLFLRRRAK